MKSLNASKATSDALQALVAPLLELLGHMDTASALLLSDLCLGYKAANKLLYVPFECFASYLLKDFVSESLRMGRETEKKVVAI